MLEGNVLFICHSHIILVPWKQCLCYVHEKVSNAFPSLNSCPDNQSLRPSGSWLACSIFPCSFLPSHNDKSCSLSLKLFDLGVTFLILAHWRGLKSVLPSNISEHQQTEGCRVYNPNPSALRCSLSLSWKWIFFRVSTQRPQAGMELSVNCDDATRHAM